MQNELETAVILREVERCEDSEDLRRVLRQYQGHYLDWQEFIREALDEGGYSYEKLAGRCGVSKNTVKSWCQRGGAPRCRNTYLKLAFGLGMNVEETNRLLIRYGGYPGLYARELFDAVCLFLLERRARLDVSHGYGDAELLFEACSGRAALQDQNLETRALETRIRSLRDTEEFIRFSAEYAASFAERRGGLCQYLRTYVAAKQEEARLLGDKASVRRYFADSGIPSRYGKVYSRIVRHGIVPRKEQLIALGLYLEMTVDELNRLLRLAGMEPLCAKNRLECVIIYALQQLCLLHPELPLSNALLMLRVAEDAQLRREYQEIVAEYTANHYRSADSDPESVAAYVRDILAEIDEGQARELLELL